MDRTVSFSQKVPDGTYMAEWEGFDVTITIDKKEIKGRCSNGTVGDPVYAVVEVKGGNATLRRAR